MIGRYWPGMGRMLGKANGILVWSRRHAELLSWNSGKREPRIDTEGREEKTDDSA